MSVGKQTRSDLSFTEPVYAVEEDNVFSMYNDK